MNKLLEAALDYAIKGWPIFPTRLDKTPYTKHGVIEATTNPDIIQKWWIKWPKANIALDVGGAGMMVLDLDPGYDMKELEENVGLLPETLLCANTPRGGKHLFFSLKDGEIVSPSASKLARNVDTRSFHSYVLLTPSKTKDGEYTWESDGKPAYRTNEMVRLSNSAREKHKDRDNWLIDEDLPENVHDATQWLLTEAKIAIKGQGGDAMTYATAAHMKSFGISKERALELLWDHWCPRCIPPWDADGIDNLTLKVENAYTYNTSPPGNITNAYHTAKTSALFSPTVTSLKGSGTEVNAGRFRFVNYSGLSQIKSPKWLIKNFLPENSYSILFGAPGTFKTFLALDIALTIAMGFCVDKNNMCWPEIQSQGSVLFAAGEGRSSISNRVKAWSKTHFGSNEIAGFVLGDPVPLVSEELKPFIDGALAISPTDSYKLVVLDTVGRAMQGLNENSQEHASAFTNMVEHIQYETGAAVLALHHTGFVEQHRARGSSVFGADADTIVRLERQKKDNFVSLTMTKQKDAPEWERPKYIKLQEVSIGLETKTLVAVAVPKQENPTLKDEQRAENQVMLLDIIEEAILDHLKGLQQKKFTNADLAEAVASYKVGVLEQQIKKRYFPILRASDRPVSRCWLKDIKRWRWQD